MNNQFLKYGFDSSVKLYALDIDWHKCIIKNKDGLEGWFAVFLSALDANTTMP
jgi:hypothetical protein